ncbi:MAG TPA: zinc-binding alcohol dehydrogenase family protein [Verrucomicrobiae bacterium]|nr:zinc-binding alcohol dehydrogenase family protein [Verrucomicrobiae bacterium]
MKAVALTHYLPINDPKSLTDVELPQPKPTGSDVLVRIEAISVNPVDAKIRAPKSKVESAPRVLGWDAAGIVEAVGPDVEGFKEGDEVYYAGDVNRPGCNSEFQLVDERLISFKPLSLSFAEAAALPLTTITSWEALFEKLNIDLHGDNAGKTLLIIGGAGGVGSITIQLAKLAGLTVIATASRPETVEWVAKLGADHVIDHTKPLPAQLAAIGHKEVDYIANFANTDKYWATMAEVIRPLGKIVSIVENTAPVDLNLLKSKSASFSWEFMFAKALHQTEMASQGELLEEVADLIDSKKLRTTLTETLTPINAENLRKAHAQLESGRTIGKLVLEKWS